MIKFELWNIFSFDFRLTLTLVWPWPFHLNPGNRISEVVYIHKVYVCVQNIRFWTFVKMVLIKNNDIYIFANLSANLYLCKLDNHLMERRVS